MVGGGAVLAEPVLPVHESALLLALVLALAAALLTAPPTGFLVLGILLVRVREDAVVGGRTAVALRNGREPSLGSDGPGLSPCGRGRIAVARDNGVPGVAGRVEARAGRSVGMRRLGGDARLLPEEPAAVVLLEAREHPRQALHVRVAVLAVHEHVNHQVEAVLDPVKDVQEEEPHGVLHLRVEGVDHHDGHAAHQHEHEDDENGAGDAHVSAAGAEALAHRGRLVGAAGGRAESARLYVLVMIGITVQLFFHKNELYSKVIW